MSVTAKIETNFGDMVIDLYEDKTPNTVKNFMHLASTHFYDGIIFHRVIKDFMIQAGCPDGMGTGGPGYCVKDEFLKELTHDRKGILSMANRGPNTNGSQFFITLTKTPWLDGKHTVFGHVTEGIEVLEKIGNVRTEFMDRPAEPVMIASVILYRDGKTVSEEIEKPEIFALGN